MANAQEARKIKASFVLAKARKALAAKRAAFKAAMRCVYNFLTTIVEAIKAFNKWLRNGYKAFAKFLYGVAIAPYGHVFPALDLKRFKLVHQELEQADTYKEQILHVYPKEERRG